MMLGNFMRTIQQQVRYKKNHLLQALEKKPIPCIQKNQSLEYIHTRKVSKIDGLNITALLPLDWKSVLITEMSFAWASAELWQGLFLLLAGWKEF